MDPIPSPDQERVKHAGNVQNHAEAYANGVLRQRTTFERHHVNEALVSAFISGADFAGGSATLPNPQAQEQPTDKLHTAFSTDEDEPKPAKGKKGKAGKEAHDEH